MSDECVSERERCHLTVVLPGSRWDVAGEAVEDDGDDDAVGDDGDDAEDEEDVDDGEE